MAIRVQRLNVRIRVRTGRRSGLLHAAPAAPRPAMTFLMPQGNLETEGPLPASEMATQEPPQAHNNQAAAPSSRRADPAAVTDRVYELMKQEARVGRLRAGKDWN